MTPLIDYLRNAADGSGEPVALEHKGTGRMYYVYSEELHRKATQAIQALEDNEAIAEGLQQMEKGEGRPLHEFDADLRREFGLPPRQ